MLRIRKHIPTALTLINAACGMVGLAVLVLADRPALPLAAGLVFLGWVFDIADGLAARVLRTRSEFGQALDSLADAICFVVLPTLLAVAQASGDARVVVAAAIFAICGLLRLGRFTSEGAGDAVFSGLPSVVAAMLVAALVLVGHGPVGGGGEASAAPGPLVLSLGLLVAGLLMVSRVPYSDLPKRVLRAELPRWPFAVGFIAIVIDPSRLVLVAALLAYICAYPVRRLILRRVA